MEPVACRKSSNKAAKPQLGEGKTPKRFAGQENNFTHLLLREGRRKLDIQFIKARREHVVMLPLATRDRNENRARSRGAAPKFLRVTWKELHEVPAATQSLLHQQ